jgi:gliding motility-associated-like protein
MGSLTEFCNFRRNLPLKRQKFNGISGNLRIKTSFLLALPKFCYCQTRRLTNKHMNTFLRSAAAVLCCLFFISSASAQVRLTVTVTNTTISTTCDDGSVFGVPLGIEPAISVQIAGQNTYYYEDGDCPFFNATAPFLQYDEDLDCPSDYPATMQICLEAYEEDGFCATGGPDCYTTACQNFATPPVGGSITHTMNISGNGSTGSVTFTISSTGSFTLPGSAYDQVCNAINLGTLNSNASIGNDGLSNYGNFCATNTAEPNPWGGDNDQGVWFQFTTGPNPSTTIRFNAVSDPQGLGDGIDLQLALYESSNGTCTGALSLVEDEYQGLGLLFDEEMIVECLQPNTTYFLMVDGEDLTVLGLSNGGQQGFFGLEIYDQGVTQSADLICDAQFLGAVPAGGSIGTPNLSQSNICAGNAGDPTPGNWTPDQTVWFSFTAPPSGHAIIDAQSDLPFPIGDDAVDLQLALYESSNNTCTGTLTEVDSDFDPIIFDEELDVRCLEPGRIYYIMVDGSGLNVDGIFDITVSDGGIPPAPNDEICDAIPLGQPAPGGTVGLNNQNNFCADNLFEPIPSNWGNDQGVWYTFVAPPSGKVEIRLDNPNLLSDQIDLQVAVYDAQNQACTDPLTELASEHEGIGILWDEDMEVECLIPGRTYYILVDGEGSIINPDLQEGQFDIEVYADPRDPAAPNDDPCNAIPLGDPTGSPVGTTPITSHGSQNNFCATAVGEPNPSGFTPNQTVWYTFVAPATGNVNIFVNSDAVIGGEDPIDIELAVWESPGCAGPWREIQSGDDLLGYDLDMDVNCLTPGETYYIQLDGSDLLALIGSDEGYFDLTLTELPSFPIAPNDEICNAVALGDPFASGSVGIANQNNLCADDIGDPQPDAFGTDQTVWYTFTTPATGGPYAVDVSASTGLPWPFGSGSIDLQVAVFESSNNTCTGTLTEVDSDYDPIIFDEDVTVQCLQPNTTYFVMIDGSFFDQQGYFDLNISPAPSVPIPTNDLICNAEPLGAVPIGGSINNNVNYFNFCADTEPGEPSPFGIDQTVWFTFQAPNYTGPNASSEVTISVEADPNGVGDLVDLQLAVYESSTGTCVGNLSLLENGSDDPTFSFDAEVSVTCLQPGATYFVQVDGTLLNMEGYFTIEVEDDGSGLFPTNDDICNATPLGTVPNGGSINNNVNYFNYCATTEPGEPNPDAFGIDETVWFTFVAPTSGNVTIDAFSDPNNVGDDPNLQIALWYAPGNTCAGPFLEVDSDYDGIFFDESMSVECLIPGYTYYLQVDATDAFFGDDEGDFTLQITDDGGTTNFPYNNDICNAYNFGVPGGAFTQLNNETNVCANVELGEPGLGSYASHTVWYQFTAPPSGLVEIEVESTDPIFGMDPEVYLFASSDNTCNGALSLNESANFPTAIFTEEIEAVCLIPGNNYFIQVDGSNLTVEGTFDIRIRDLEPLYGTGLPGDPEPANNLCSNAIPVPVQSESCADGNGSWNMYNYGVPTPSVNPSCGQNCGETWYTFTMPASGIALVEGNDDDVGPPDPILGDFSDMHVAAYTGSCGNLTEINCDGGGLGDDVGFEVAAPPGTQIFLQVFNSGGEDNNEDFELCVSEGCGADNCLNAMAYPIQPNIPYCFNTAAASGENVSGGTPGYFECGEGDDPENSIYYYFVSDCNGSAVTLNVINATASGGCLLGTIPDDGFNISFFQDATPCDNNPDALVDCQNFNSCMPQPINWSFTYTNLLPNTPYIIQIDGGFSFLGGDNSGYIMVQTTTNPVVLPTSTPVTCGGSNDGTATATTVGGVPPFTFQWSNGSTDSIATNLAPGTYTVTVTSAGVGGCFDTASVVVGNPVLMDAVINSVTDETCPGACDGTASANATGGTVITGYTYQWDAAANNQTTQTATGLCAGSYVVTVSDNGGCFDTAQVIIGSPSGVTATLASTTDALCNGVCDGSGTVAATGGTITTDYTYVWPTADSTATATGLCAGSYNVTISDRNGCADTVTVVINQPLGVDASIANQTDILCNGDANGSFEVLGINGTAPYTYDNGAGPQAGNTFTNLAAGNYIVTVTDDNGCTDTAAVTISEPPILTIQLVSTLDVSCNGLTDGEIVVNGTGGTPALEYAIDGINFQSSTTFSNLAAGNYTITVRDANNCTATVAATINEPAAININLVGQTAASCGLCDGSANITASGGAGGFTYQWSSGETTEDASALCAGNNEVTVTDANGCTASLPVTISNAAGFAANVTVDSISCAGAADGQITVIPAGGTAPYTYNWSNGATTDIQTGLAAGTYEVTVEDASACSFIGVITLNDPAVLTALAAETQAVSCNGNSDGQAIATPSGGTAPYTYSWDNGETTQTATALNAGSHDVTVVDANNCSTVATVTITEPAAFAVSIVNVTASICGPVGCDGTAQIAVSGGLSPYTYAWSNGDVTAAPTNLCSGFNDITVTDASGCTTTDAVNIPSNSSLNLSIINSSNPTCFGDCDGSAIVSASGGNTASPYTFTWDNGATTANITGLCDGIYRVTVSDVDGCTNAIAVTITEPAELIATAIVSSDYNGEDISCLAATDGEATVNISGGTPAYTINWDNAVTTPINAGLAAGTYQVTVVDANNCSDTSIVTLQDPPAFVVNAVVTSDYNGSQISCVGAADGEATATASGGTGTYTYAWSDGQTTAVATGLMAGTYDVTATDANGCEVVTSITLSDPPALTANATASSDYNGVNVSCNGSTDGEATVAANGGTGTYTFVWSTGDATALITGLSAGTYIASVTDDNGCTVVDSTVITEPAPLSNTFTTTDISCNGGTDGTASASVSGGTTAYTYNWDNGATTALNTGLSAGITYYLTVTDANGCELVDSLILAEPTVLTATTDSTAVLCQGNATGTATVNPSGATPAYSYNWSDGQTTQTAIDLVPGLYTVTVTDANNCSIVENINVDDVPAITQATTTVDVLCNGGNNGEATFTVAGGVGGFTYLWSDGQTTATATGLTAGTYCVTATDANGCTVTDCPVINEPPALTTPTFNVVDMICATVNDGELTANTTGGVPPYTYNWSDGQTTQTATGLGVGTYTISITDANGCQITGSAAITSPPFIQLTLTTDSVNCKNDADGSATVVASGGVGGFSYQWSNGVTTDVNANIPAGPYSVTVTDANGCTATDNVNVGEPASAVVASVLATIDPDCNGASNGAIDADALGGTPNYTFLWSTGDTTEDLSNLPAGTYSLTATDATGCSATTSTILTEPTAVVAVTSQYSNYNGAAISCTGAADGAVQVNTSGGVGPYTITWSTGANTQIINNLGPGTYYVFVTDASGCMDVDSISITEPLPMQATETHTDVSCYGACDGTITANAVAGTGTLGIGGYEYRILGPGQLGNVFSNVNTFTGLCAGTYTVEVRDGNGCMTSLTVVITEPAALATNITTNNTSCNGGSDGTATATVSGGTIPYSYNWSNGSTDSTTTGLAAGGHSLTITDANGCELISTFNITEPSAITATTDTDSTACNGTSNGSAIVFPSGGTAPYSYNWSNGSTMQQAIGLTAGTYNVTITDANGCELVTSASVEEPAPISATISAVNLSCTGNATGSATVVPTGGTAPYTYLWSDGQTTASATALAIGSYIVIVTDANGCQTNASVSITQPTPVVATFLNATNASCNGVADGTATVGAAGGTAPYTYSWPDGQVGAIATGLAAGTYTVTVTDANGCFATVDATVNQPTAVVVDSMAMTPVSCKFGTDGTATAYVNGGTLPYTYAWSNGATTQSLSNIPATTYNFTVTDANGCSASSSIIVTEPASELVGLINTTGALCQGGSSGQLTAVISGGTLPASGDYTYNWSNGATTPVNDNLSAGTYTLTVTDANGCSLVLSQTVSQAGSLSVSVVSTVDASCAGGSNGMATVTASGGTGTLTFQWPDGQNTAQATGLSAGTYAVTVTDQNGCFDITTLTIGEGAAVSLDANINNVSCFGEGDGFIDVTNSNSTIAVYQWSNGQIGNPASNLAAGAYSLTVTTVQNCDAVFNFVVTQPNELEAELETIAGITCRDEQTGILEVSANGGTPAYSYSWSNAATGASLTNLSAGTYTVTVTDANGCQAVDVAQLGNPEALAVDAISSGVACVGDANGSIQVSGFGGSTALGQYEYSLDSANWQSGNLFPNLTNGDYTVYVRDNNGCIATTDVSVDAATEFFITSFTPSLVGIDTTIEYGDTIVLSVELNDTNGVIFSWMDVNANLVLNDSTYELMTNPANATIYEFSAVSPEGCMVDTSITIRVTKTRVASAPTGFTPNGDGVNDAFFIQTDDKVTNVAVFRVFDRWGEMVYEGTDLTPNDPQQGWDGTFRGKELQSAVYAWYAEVEFIDGEKVTIRGSVTLLR